MTEPAISVIIPAYRPDNFAALKASMDANSEVDAEWIVVDDGSGLDYAAVFDNLSQTPARVIQLTKNRRQAAARNAGLAQAKGAWVKFLDADDQLGDGHLTALLAATNGTNIIPFAPTRHLFPGGGTMVNISWRDVPAEPKTQLERLLYAPFLHHCGAVFPRELLTELGGYDESLVTDEDGDLLLRVSMEGKSFLAVPDVQYHYVHHRGTRVSSDDDLSKMAARLRVCEKVEAAFGDAMPASIRNALARRLDKIAMTYFEADPGAAKDVLLRARALSPNYVPDMRAPLRLLRWLGGPGTALTAANLYRQLRGRPKGGAQG